MIGFDPKPAVDLSESGRSITFDMIGSSRPAARCRSMELLDHVLDRSICVHYAMQFVPSYAFVKEDHNPLYADVLRFGVSRETGDNSVQALLNIARV